MILPFDRERLRQWNVREQRDEITAARAETPASRLRQAIGLSNLTLRLNVAGGGAHRERGDLADKARQFAAPLRVFG